MTPTSNPAPSRRTRVACASSGRPGQSRRRRRRGGGRQAAPERASSSQAPRRSSPRARARPHTSARLVSAAPSAVPLPAAAVDLARFHLACHAARSGAAPLPPKAQRVADETGSEPQHPPSERRGSKQPRRICACVVIRRSFQQSRLPGRSLCMSGGITMTSRRSPRRWTRSSTQTVQQ